MAYVGTPIDTRNQFQSLQGKRFNGDGSTTDFTLDVAPGSTLDIEVFVGNVRQDPNSAYTVSGTTLSFTGAPPSGTNNIYVVHQAKSVGTIDVPAGGVAADSLATSVLTGQTDIGAAIADSDLFLVDDGAGGTLRKTAASRLKTYAGFSVSDITGATALTDIPVTTDELLISDAGTLKRLDYSLVVPFAGALVYSTSTQSNISANSDVKVAFNAEMYDTDSFHDNSTNNTRFTIPGKFNGFKALFRGHVTLEDVSDGTNYEIRIFKNNASNSDGAQLLQGHRSGSASGTKTIGGTSHPVTLGTDDYFELVVSTTDSDVDISNGANGNNEVYFGAFSITIIPGSGS